jgi:hypothetical protein
MKNILKKGRIKIDSLGGVFVYSNRIGIYEKGEEMKVVNYGY